MSILTKEVIQKILNDDWLLMDDCEGLENCTVIKELARMALAAIDSEPLAYIIQDKYERERGVEGHLSRSHVSKHVSQEDINEHEITCIPLYRYAQPAPVVPDGYVMVPMRLTAENGAKGALSGEFSETKFVNCPECFGDDECETCDGSGRIEITVPVSWTTIKEIWAKGVEHFAAAPQEVKGE